MFANKVKLVIWDLDETFWRGALAEEGMTPEPRNAEIVIELSRRGIINSICSKNDFERAKAKLEELGVWDYFVFPAISFNPKGKAVAEMIETAALRAENVLFIDDNPSNCEEVKYYNPGIMACHPNEALPRLLDHPHLKGKPDPELTRLKQYRLLQRKAEDRAASVVSNEDFLRACNIRISIDHDVEANFDRVVELINRTNQLNYTKKRLESEETVAEFRELLNTFTYTAGCVRARDDYGDYGLIGFFLLKSRARSRRLVHFVFSCRTMNMGIEQYVYEMLGRPEIDIAAPVSYGLETHKEIDWIAVEDGSGGAADSTPTGKLVLVGGCDLLQLASFCSNDRIEFVNRVQDKVPVRLDDPGFIVSDRNAVARCESIKAFPCWGYEDALALDRGLSESELVLISFWAAMNGEYFLIDDSVLMRLSDKQVKRLQKRDPELFERTFRKKPLDEEGRIGLILEACDALAERAPQSAIFVLGCYTKGELNKSQIRRRQDFNLACRAYCERRADRFHYVDVDAIVPADHLVDKVHFIPAGYHALARNILERAKTRERPLQGSTGAAPAPIMADFTGCDADAG
ncbi:MAG TPA: hypothetical protein VG843_03505 [Rhizomicrobium sp.]|jgi:FkbH-like protein|nr:hypothetical protein [Rhizomicrobium sp.]